MLGTNEALFCEIKGKMASQLILDTRVRALVQNKYFIFVCTPPNCCFEPSKFQKIVEGSTMNRCLGQMRLCFVRSGAMVMKLHFGVMMMITSVQNEHLKVKIEPLLTGQMASQLILDTRVRALVQK
ncbi:uncharacterized protein [Primulina huaijiensis]|uniref:uncharacterized protein n=1 Tax=Primulina huaijiensis TaxID=1492673 RepID=UPI003CC78786